MSRYDTGIITTSIAHDSFKDCTSAAKPHNFACDLTRRADMKNPNDAATGAIVATYIAGEAVGAITQSIIGDKLGRKRFMQLMCLIVSNPR